MLHLFSVAQQTVVPPPGSAVVGWEGKGKARRVAFSSFMVFQGSIAALHKGGPVYEQIPNTERFPCPHHLPLHSTSPLLSPSVPRAVPTHSWSCLSPPKVREGGRRDCTSYYFQIHSAFTGRLAGVHLYPRRMLIWSRSNSHSYSHSTYKRFNAGVLCHAVTSSS